MGVEGTGGVAVVDIQVEQRRFDLFHIGGIGGQRPEFVVLDDPEPDTDIFGLHDLLPVKRQGDRCFDIAGRQFQGSELEIRTVLSRDDRNLCRAYGDRFIRIDVDVFDRECAVVVDGHTHHFDCYVVLYLLVFDQRERDLGQGRGDFEIEMVLLRGVVHQPGILAARQRQYQR